MDTDEQEKPIIFSLDERDLILDLMSIDLEMEKRFKLAVLKGNSIVIEMNAYDLDLLLDDIAADANHSKQRTLQNKLRKLFDRLSEILESEFSG